MTTYGFTPSQLQLPYVEWVVVRDACRKSLSPEARKWLAAWSLWDLACSPMDDEIRRRIRYGHYLGWFDARL